MSFYHWQILIETETDSLSGTGHQILTEGQKHNSWIGPGQDVWDRTYCPGRDVLARGRPISDILDILASRAFNWDSRIQGLAGPGWIRESGSSLQSTHGLVSPRKASPQVQNVGFPVLLKTYWLGHLCPIVLLLLHRLCIVNMSGVAAPVPPYCCTITANMHIRLPWWCV